MKSIFLSIIVIFIALPMSGQIEQMSTGNTEVFGNNQPNDKFFRLQHSNTDTISIKIIDPGGEIKSIPVKKQRITSRVDFGISTKYWRKGWYTIIAENKNGFLYRKRFLVGEEE